MNFFLSNFHMVKYFLIGVLLCFEFVVQFGPAILRSFFGWGDHHFQWRSSLFWMTWASEKYHVVRYYHIELFLKMIFDSYFSYGHKAQARAKNYKTKNDDNQYRVFHFYYAYCFKDNNANFSVVMYNNIWNLIEFNSRK